MTHSSNSPRISVLETPTICPRNSTKIRASDSHFHATIRLRKIPHLFSLRRRPRHTILPRGKYGLAGTFIAHNVYFIVEDCFNVLI